MAGIGAEFELRGDREMKARLESLGGEMQTRGKAALTAVMQEELEEMRNRTPTLSGALAASGRLVPAVVTTEDVSVGVRFGEGIEPYAVAQHENLRYEHEDGYARFVTSVLDESRPFLVGRILRKIFGA